MAVPQRLQAIRRLFLAKLEKVRDDLPHKMRSEMARKELDKVLGPVWREEVEAAGFQLDPTGDMGCDMEERLDKLPMATREEGYHGDDVPPPTKKKSEEDEEKEKDSIIIKLIRLIHG